MYPAAPGLHTHVSRLLADWQHARTPSSLQEVDKFSKAFKDPEFLKLFEEYAKEVSDPKVRAHSRCPGRKETLADAHNSRGVRSYVLARMRKVASPHSRRRAHSTAADVTTGFKPVHIPYPARSTSARNMTGRAVFNQPERALGPQRSCATLSREPSQVKAETDLYLRQLEAEGRGSEVYGKDVTLIIPTEQYVIKTKDKNSGTKVFINMCSSDKLEKLSMESTKGPDGKAGKSVQIPLSLSQKKTGQDKSGKAAWVWDFVVHPHTLDMAQRNPAIKKLVVDTVRHDTHTHTHSHTHILALKACYGKQFLTWLLPRLRYAHVYVCVCVCVCVCACTHCPVQAMEHIDVNNQVSLSRDYKVMSMKYKGTPEAPK